MHSIQRGTGGGGCRASRRGAELGWVGEGEVDVEIEVKGQPQAHRIWKVGTRGSNSPAHCLLSHCGTQKRKAAVHMAPSPLSSCAELRTQWLSTYPGATELAYRRWHPIMCLFKALFLGMACLECLSSYALFHSERIQLKSVHLGMEEVRFHN